MFADLGADVILVEPPNGSPGRAHPPLVDVEGAAVSAHFAFLAAGKRSVALDLDAPDGRALLDALVAVCDVALVPDAVDDQRARGLDATRLRARNPRLVVTSVSAFGTTGPRRHWRGSDLVGWASSGAMYGMGDPDRPPVAPGGGVAHAAGALNAALGTMLALRARQRSSTGQAVDISLQEAVMSVAMEAGPLYSLEGQPQARSGPRRLGAHGMFPVQDGNVEVVAFLPTQWDAMAQWIADELGVEEATSDAFRGPSARFEFRELIEAWTLELAGRYTKQEFFLEAQRRRIPCGPINTSADLLADPQLAAVDGWVEVAHPEVGRVRLPRGPARFDGEPTPVGAVPAIGEHTVAVLRDVLGRSDDEIVKLARDGIVSFPSV
jgi:crotonobetainyl-CoA:carnitine CoA-transferase CaiB-like acyl-CoA transferase